jgi:hypothetical protein
MEINWMLAQQLMCRPWPIPFASRSAVDNHINEHQTGLQEYEISLEAIQNNTGLVQVERFVEEKR